MYKTMNLVFVGVCLFALPFTKEVLGSSENKTLSKIATLRERVLPMIPLNSRVRNFTQDDLYLLKWLEASSMDVGTAVTKISDHLDWRKREDIDSVVNSTDWSNFRHDPLFTGQHDKSGQPVGEMWLSEWNLRRAIVAGLRRKLTRWIIRTVELQQIQLYETRRQGSNATNVVLLVDLEGFNFFTHGCRSCLMVIAYWGEAWETQYPNLYNEVIMINATPTIHSLILMAMQTRMKPSSTKLLKPFTTDTTTWMPFLDDAVDRSERSLRFGGSLKRDY